MTSNGSQPSATATPLSARALSLLDEVGALCTTRLQPLLSLTLTEAEQRLFRRAEQSPNNVEQQRCLDSQRMIKQQRAAIMSRTLEALAKSRVRFGEPAPGRSQSGTSIGLELLTEHAQEESIVVDDIAARCESRATMVLFELGHRYAVLGARPVLEAATQPFGPYALCRSLQEAVDTLDMPAEHRIEVYRAFERAALTGIDGLYDALNQHLIARGVLPNLRVFAPRRRSPQDGTPSGAPSTAGPAPEDRNEDGNAAATGVPFGGDEDDASGTFAALTELLAQRRRQQSPAAARGSGYVPAADELQRVLGVLQTRPAEVRASGGGMQPRSMQQLRQDMMAQLRQSSPDASAPHLAAEHLDVVELMSMLFDRLVEDVHSPQGSTLLSQMQAPLLRVALADNGFFTQRDHPARRWLNTLAEVSARWGGEGEEGDAGLIERMRAMTRRINEEFNGDVGIFSGMADDLQKQADALTHRAEVTERRHIEASKGRERLELARLRAEELVAARLHLRYDHTPSLTRNLLQHAWTDVLALTLLREGEDSEHFRRELAITDALTADPSKPPVDPIDREQLREDIEHGLARVGMPSRDAEVLAREAIGQPVTDASGEPVTRTELALKLKQRKRLGSAGAAAEEEAQQAPGLDAAEQRALEQLKTMAFGTWFDFDSDPPGTVVRRKMAWYSTKTGNCLLVNQRGARTDTTTLEQMARGMAAGRIRLPAPVKGSLIDRALDAILNKLKVLTGNSNRAAEGSPS
jgi:hypothetical protein